MVFTQGEARLQAVFSDLIEPRWLNCCSRGHIAYTGIYAMCEECPECGERQYNSHGKPNCCWPYIPLIPRLAIQYHSATRSRQLTTYRREFPTLDGTVKDVFDGEWFRECCDIGYFTDPRTLALRITLDGIGLTKNTRPEQKITPVVIYLLNLHPSIRDQHANALTSFVIPGSFKEEYIDTWLDPLMTELRTLCGGVSGVWDGATGESFVLRAHPILVTGDGQAVADIMGTKHPGNALLACRMCPFKGSPFGRKKYYPHNNTVEHPVYGDSRPLFERINVASQTSRLARFKELQRQLGINRRTILLDIPTLHFPRSFPVDTMHCVNHNIPKHFMKLWKGDAFKDQNLPWVLPQYKWESIDRSLNASRGHVPTQIATAPRGTKTYKMWTASEYRAFFLTYGAPMILDALSQHAKATLLQFRLIMRVVGKIEYSHAEIDTLWELCADFVVEFERECHQRNPALTKVCTIQLHYLLHLAQNVRDFGSPIYYAQWGLERSLRDIKNIAISSSAKYKSLCKNMLATERTNHLSWARCTPP